MKGLLETTIFDQFTYLNQHDCIALRRFPWTSNRPLAPSPKEFISRLITVLPWLDAVVAYSGGWSHFRHLENIFNKTSLLAITSTIIAIFNWNSRDISVTAWLKNNN